VPEQRIAARGRPTRDYGAGILVKLAVDLGTEAETGEAALHVAAFAPPRKRIT